MLNPSWTTLAVSASGDTLVLTANADIFNKYDVIKAPYTGEVMLVTSVTTTAVTVVRRYGSTNSADLAVNRDLVIIGSAFAEGSLATALGTMSTKTACAYNYLQIFRKAVEITRTLANTELYGGADRPYQRKKKGVELMRDLERSFLYGERYEDIASKDSTTGVIRRITAGIRSYISTNTTDAGGALTEAEFEGFLRKVFRYGSNSRYLFCAPLILSVISLWAQGKKLIALFKSSLINGRSLRRPSSASRIENICAAATTERDELSMDSKRQSELHENEHAANTLKLQMFPKDKTSQTVGPCIKNLTKSMEVYYIMIDNIEERLSEKDLGWLAGILDGEGSFGIYNYGRKGIVARLEIPNTDKNLVLEAMRISSEIVGHPIKLKTRIPSSQLNIKHKKRQYSFQLSNMKLVYTLLSTIKNYLRSYKKKQLANLICEYADLRRQRDYKSSLTQREQDILSQIGRIRNDYTSDCVNTEDIV